jgi:hypothetical protein
MGLYRGYRAAVDMEIGSGDVAGAIGDDKRHEFGDLVAAAGTLRTMPPSWRINSLRADSSSPPVIAVIAVMASSTR